MANSQVWCQEESVKNKTWFVRLLLAVFFGIVQIISDAIYWFIYRNKEKTQLPAIEDPILLESATSLAKKIRTQKITSEEVVSVFINRIKAVNPIINCVVDNRFQLALKEAQKADKLIQSGEKDEETLELETPFLGVPFTIKDCFSVAGLHYTSGLVKRKDLIGQFDSDVVALMKKAGAIMLAITNVPELCMWWESLNNVYGRSRNPYDTNRTVGGSSGGEAGLLASGGSPFGIGSDIGGSIRLPAFFNGIFGHKPTSGIVSNHEQQPVAGKVLQTYLVTGPMSRFCSDLLPMYRILAADNTKKLKLDEKVSLSKIRYFYVEHFGKNPILSRVHPDLKEAQRKVVRHIEKTYNVPVQKMKFPKLYHAMEMWSVKMTAAGNPPFVAELAMGKGQISLIAEFLKYCVGQCEHTLFALAMGLLEKLCPPSTHPLSVKMIEMCDELKKELQELLGDDGVLLVPPHPTASFYHNQSLTRPFDFAYVAIFNILGFPITQVPLGLGSWGVPLGVQVIGNLRNDHLTLAVAAELERAFGGWVSPSPISC
ncbi:fatty-acid amide hydrolase 2-like [Daphnia pulicaria]|uniref:fatty-acid amide hydrolase 2-like n=1 Tax=Daphnia pulicaria TaxID=35523 RepID=UPI001EEBA783|nr:fatty-acid amide hydrolase 2-like [Daphnia pulicaria]